MILIPFALQTLLTHPDALILVGVSSPKGWIHIDSLKLCGWYHIETANMAVYVFSWIFLMPAIVTVLHLSLYH